MSTWPANGALLLAIGRARTVVGVDRYVPTDAAAEKLTKFHCADIGEWVKSSSEQFDTIIALDVLEHLVDPWTILADCRRLLRPNGLVVASIPNIRFVPVLVDLVGRGRFDYRDAGVLDRTHLRFFTRRSIVAMFDEAGFGALTVRRLANPRRSPLRRLVAVGPARPGLQAIRGPRARIRRDSGADGTPSSSCPPYSQARRLTVDARSQDPRRTPPAS